MGADSGLVSLNVCDRPCSCQRVVMAKIAGIRAPTRCTFREHQDGGFLQLMMLACTCENTGTCLVQCQGLVHDFPCFATIGFVYATFFLNLPSFRRFLRAKKQPKTIPKRLEDASLRWMVLYFVGSARKAGMAYRGCSMAEMIRFP